MSAQIRVVAILTAQPGKGGELLAMWPALSAQVHAEAGCLAYDLHRVGSDADRFVVLERWASVEALGEHRGAAHMRQFGRDAAGVLAGPAEVVVLEDEPAA